MALKISLPALRLVADCVHLAREQEMDREGGPISDCVDVLIARTLCSVPADSQHPGYGKRNDAAMRLVPEIRRLLVCAGVHPSAFDQYFDPI